MDRDTEVSCCAWVERVDAAGRLHVLLSRLPGTVLADGRRVRPTWALPGGGPGLREGPEQAVVREVARQTGYAVRLTGMLGADSVLVPPHDRHTPGGDRFLQHLTLVWTAEVVSGRLSAGAGGGTDVAWVPVEEIDGLDRVPGVTFGLRALGRGPLRRPALAGTPVDEVAVARVLSAVEAARQGRARGHPRDGRHPGEGAPFVIAVDGPSGSGKSVLATAVAQDLGAPLLHMDDLFPGWDGLPRAPALLTEQVLEPLARGGRAAYRRWDWHRDGWAEEVEVPSTDLLVVEGCGSSVRPAAEHLTLAVWVEAGPELRMRRGLARDGESYRPQWERWAAQEDELYAADGTRTRADVVVRTG